MACMLPVPSRRQSAISSCNIEFSGSQYVGRSRGVGAVVTGSGQWKGHSGGRKLALPLILMG